MKALVWHGRNDVRIDNVPDPAITDTNDIILKVTSTAICGSDLHILDGMVPTMEKGDILGHEFMGEVVAAGKNVRKFRPGDRVVVPFTIACGHCEYCNDTLYSLCDNSNPNPEMARANLGHSVSGIFGYSHMLGGFDGGQAEYVRVPYADVGPVKVPESLSDDQSLFLSDIFPTGYMAAENADINRGDTVAVWGCGPVGQLAIQSAWMLGAARVIAIDNVPERLSLAKNYSLAETINTTDRDDVYEELMEMTNGKGPDCCIDAVGAEAHGDTMVGKAIDKTKEILQLPMSRPYVLQQMIMGCKKAGTVSIPGVYIGMVNEIPFGAAMNKALTFRMGQTHVQRYLQPLLKKIEEGLIDPGFIITHRMKLEDAPQAYEIFKKKKDNCIKVVLTP
ncbi:glutathione-dependent formaldehyde dehydrogenase [Sinomicrobium pectinilyticum]|uniref:Glutathione-dependent formaldehyde dehydrogenase n=1 Tax=Sinomicrobium pectinilyticum TaxID=1084421 RepID=A0A3N0EHE6_SINP1|nr:zinc-dependent alcohol dehydrogenase [Sinomicrobium pectinilyticum]RNL87241.1 glutathione-dependent formaldehyde dehydrogenase [Sinomicrobium pectinilyticum]